MAKLPVPTRTIAQIRTPSTSSASSPFTQQIRHATYVHRPRRPYTFTQLIQLSDGSTYTARTTSPQPLYRADKDTRNTLLWQPSEKALRNVELDEAGKLAAFRGRFGRGFDASAQEEEGAAAGSAADQAADDGFADLISGYAPQNSASLKDSGPKKSPTRRK